ncbi:hypothetical protein FBUS_07169 [Fasciolopsis buskii]|uniref:G-protein coupled receptors family 1 profile domain-containing protein n=1 Tax=Fasciolopsis buskii TaxID=27845 RepID=A0A8E0S325_9TREM|nr:hypothetical protein FBUS_07169 [Fasciolopsis buski]
MNGDPGEVCSRDEEFYRNVDLFKKCKRDYPALITFMEVFADVYGVLGLTVCCLSVASNIMNLIILSKRWLRRPTTSILIGIAAMDLCVSISQTPILLRYYLAPKFSPGHDDHVTTNGERLGRNCSAAILNNTFDPSLHCSKSAHIVSSSDYHWICDQTDTFLSHWSVAFSFIFAQCTALTSHTTSVWFGVVLAVFRWWLVSELSRKITRMRRTISLAQQNGRLIAASATPRTDICLSRVCVQCGRAVILVSGVPCTSNVNSDANRFDRCDQCVAARSNEDQTERQSCGSILTSQWFRRTRESKGPRLDCIPRDSFTEQRLAMIRSLEAPKCGVQQRTRSPFLGRICCCPGSERMELSRSNTQRALCIVFLTVTLFLSPYYMSTNIRAAYYILMPCDLEQTHLRQENIEEFCVDNRTYITAAPAGYIPVRHEYFILDSYNFWAVAGLGKLAPCFLIATFGFRLITHLKQGLSQHLTFSNHLLHSDVTEQSHRSPKAQALKKRMRNHRRTSRLLILVILLILPVELPTAIILIGKRYTHRGECLYLSLGDLLDWLSLVKNALTFVIYCCMSSEFRTAFCDSTKALWHYTQLSYIFCGSKELHR